jgi:hypothetical protein
MMELTNHPPTKHYNLFFVQSLKEVDIIPMVLIPTMERTRLMDFTIPLLIGNSRLMLRYPEKESRLVAVVQPFSLLVNHGRQLNLLLLEFRHLE